MITVGSDPVRSRYSAAHVAFDESACASYELLENGKKVCTVVLGVPGMHNVYNSLAAFAAAGSWAWTMGISAPAFWLTGAPTAGLRKRAY